MSMTFLPTSADEIKRLGWKQPDIIIFSGDAYVDHPSFGAAVIGRTLESKGYKVAIVPQPNWRDDLRDFRKLGAPRLFFGISAGAMDSMVNHYTAARRLRHDDAYTAGGKHGMRPDYPTIVYSKILRNLFPDTPIIAGGIEASMRRLSHYDYWQDRLRPAILFDAPADMLVYGMGERSMIEIARHLDAGEKITEIKDIPQTAFLQPAGTERHGSLYQIKRLYSFEDCLKEPKKQSLNFKDIEIESNRMQGNTVLVQSVGDKEIWVNPMYPPMTTEEIDASFDLPYTRLPHPRYKGKRIPAYEMIRHSVCMHRGCFGGCAFCTISAHQGKFISSRSIESIQKELKHITEMPDFKGYISDLGGPSANMYAMGGKNREACKKCIRPSCLHPAICPNLNVDHSKLLGIYKLAANTPGVKKAFVGSGVRYDLAMAPTSDPKVEKINKRYIKELIINHVSGRLKVAPEHTSDRVLMQMRKPGFALFRKFNRIFDETCANARINQQLIPYFISSHPGCTEEDMAELAAETKRLNFHLEQVQDFTPTPMTLATEIFYSGYDPYTDRNVFTAHTDDEKKAQRKYFFWYQPEMRRQILQSLNRLHRPDLAVKIYGHSKRDARNATPSGNHSHHTLPPPKQKHK